MHSPKHNSDPQARTSVVGDATDFAASAASDFDPVNNAVLSPPELEKIILQLAHGTGSKRRKGLAQQRSELAVLLFEARRASAYRALGYPTLSALGSASGIGNAALRKYVTAGKGLYMSRPDLHDAVLDAFRTGGRRPELPHVSRLALASSARRQLVASTSMTAGEVLDSELPLRATKIVLASDRYGGADGKGRAVLAAVDAFLVQAQELRGVLLKVDQSEPRGLPLLALHERLEVLHGECEALARQAYALAARPGRKGGSR